MTAFDATNPRQFAWVSANAGSGKTRLLIDRVTRLLLDGANASRILCLTYTKAAAAEMATRLFERLGAWTLAADEILRAELAQIGGADLDKIDLAVARRLFAQALETPGGLRIQTIHAFCQHVLSRFPVEAGVPPRFSVIDERLSVELLGQSRMDVLARAAAGDDVLRNAIATLAAQANDGRFADMLNDAIVGRGKLKELLSRYGSEPEHFFSAMRKILDVAAGESSEQSIAQLCGMLFAEKAQLQQVAAWLAAGSTNDKKTAERLGAFIKSGIAPENYDRLKTVFFTTQHEPRAWAATQTARLAQPVLAQYLDSVQRRLLDADDRQRRCATAILTEALLRTAFAVLDRYHESKRNRAMLDYDDLIATTLRLLEKGDAAQWVLFKLDGGIDHILVDEGQDTSREQWRIVSALSEEFFAGTGAHSDCKRRTLFVVGDEKQSIFSFQGAEPAAFGEYRNGFRLSAEGAYLPFVDFRPAISRRSGQAILSFVDAVFENAAARDGLTTDSDPVRHDPHRKQAGRVEIWPWIPAPEKTEFVPLAPVDAQQPGGHAILAAQLADRIAGWLREGLCPAGDGEPLKPGDIMILVRRRNVFAEEMTRQLINRGVPVGGADRIVLTQQIAVLDLLALGHFALLPEDDLNLAALLKSPIISFTEDDLYDLAQPREGSLWGELLRRANERPIFAQACVLLSQALSEADARPPFEFFSRILNRGARARLVARLGLETSDAIDEFLALALLHEASHTPSLQSFLHWCTSTGSDVKRDMEQAGSSVRIMTVHGAKGLEAKVIILPDTIQPPGQESRSAILYTDDCAFYAMPKSLECEIVKQARAAAHAKELQEYRRLLYVATTRARDLLVVCGYLGGNRNQPPPDCWYSLLQAAAQKIGRMERINGETVLTIGAPLQFGPQPAPRERSAALPEFLRTPAAPERISPLLRPSRLSGDEPPVLSPATAAERFRRGQLIHDLLAHLPEIPLAERQKAGEAYLRRQGIAAPHSAALLREANRIIDDVVFGPLFQPGSRAEVALTATFPELGHARVSGQIDRLAVSGDTVLIADFKTNRNAPELPEKAPRAYVGQMALYRAALRKIYPDKTVACALIWTESAALMPLPGTLLDKEFERLVANAGAISAA